VNKVGLASLTSYRTSTHPTLKIIGLDRFWNRFIIILTTLRKTNMSNPILQSTPSVRFISFILLVSLSLLSGITQAGDLRIEPASPIIAVGESIPLSVFGAEGEVTWHNKDVGIIMESNPHRAIYTAPNKVGQYYVTVLDANGDTSIEVTVLPIASVKSAFSREKSVWEVFTNRSNISAITLSADGKTLWVGTEGGLEERDAITGDLRKVLTNLDGLPGNIINAIVDDDKGGLWVGTSFGGIAHKNRHDQWEVFNTDNSNLPDNAISEIVSDGNGGIWIATGVPFNIEQMTTWVDVILNQFPIIESSFEVDTLSDDSDAQLDNTDIFVDGLKILLDCENNSLMELLLGGSGESEGGLVHLSNKGQWTIFNTETSPELASDIIIDIANDGNGGLWVGTHCGGLGHLNAQDQWTFYNKNNSDLPSDFINFLYQDENNGLWIATFLNGLAHRNNQGEWKVYNKASDDLPSDTINQIVSDGNGGVWVGVGNALEEAGGLVHIQVNGEVSIFNTTNSKLPENTVIRLANDRRGGLWIGTHGAGLVLQSHGGDGTLLFNALEQSNTSSLPDNIGYIVMNDGEEGLWVGTSSFIYGSGLAYFNNSRQEWTTYNTNNGLPENDVWALAKDQNNGLWVGTMGGGLAYLNNGCDWTVYNTNNSLLPSNDVRVLLNDERDGLWIGTTNGLAHLSRSGEWMIFNTSNSSLPSHEIGELINDNQSGLWIGTALGLAYWNRTEDKWSVYNVNNSQLPHNLITDLLNDGNGGLWIATGTETQGGLVHLSENREWTVYNKTNSELPSNGIRALASDNSGGIWIGTLNGLVHRSLRGNWTIFNTTNSGLQNDKILDLANDAKNGLWVSSFGLAHLTFSQKPFICETVPNISDEECTKLLNNHRAAIIVHPNGIGTGYNSDIAVDNMATHIYQTLFLRGYDHDEIYYIAYKPNLDFNGDGTADFEVVKAPTTLENYAADDKKQIESITVEHIKQAFEWAKEKSHQSKAESVLEEPLVVIFVGHGSDDELMLGPSGNTLDELTLKAWLDNYQAETGNRVVIILEACYTGTLIDALKGPNRLIVTSTDDALAYYKDLGRTSFTRFYFNDLHRGVDYWGSQQFVENHVFAQLGQPFNQQAPQLEDSAGNIIAQDLCLNGCYGQMPEPVLTAEKAPRFIVSEAVDLVVDINDGSDEPIQSVGVLCSAHSDRQDRILGVSMSVIRPQDTQKYSDQGFETTESLLIENISRGENGKWFTRFNEFSEPGEYNFIFRAEYKIRSGRRTASALKPVSVDFQSCQTHAHYDVDAKTLHLPAVNIPNASTEDTLYQADYVLTHLDPITLELNSDSMEEINDAYPACLAYFNSSTNRLYVPAMDIPNISGGMDSFYLELERISDELPHQFTLDLSSIKVID